MLNELIKQQYTIKAMRTQLKASESTIYLVLIEKDHLGSNHFLIYLVPLMLFKEKKIKTQSLNSLNFFSGLISFHVSESHLINIDRSWSRQASLKIYLLVFTNQLSIPVSLVLN